MTTPFKTTAAQDVINSMQALTKSLREDVSVYKINESMQNLTLSFRRFGTPSSQVQNQQ